MEEKDINIEEEKTSQDEQLEESEATEIEEDTLKEENSEEDPLTKAECEIAELKDKYLRSVAEFDNYRKRTLKERAELILNGGEKVLTAILPVIDDMERAI